MTRDCLSRIRWCLPLLLAFCVTACEPPSAPAPSPAPPPPPVMVAPAPAEQAVWSPHAAAREGAMDDVQHHVFAGVDVNLRDEYGATLLHEAAAGGQIAVVEWLLTHGAAIDARDESGFDPVQLASFMDHHAVVELLLRHGAVLDDPTGEPPVADEEPDGPGPAAEVAPTLPAEWADVEFQTWTSAAGRSIEAIFLGLQQDVVLLGLPNGQTSRVPITQLQREDQIRARELAMAGQAPQIQRTGARSADAAASTRVTTGFSSECEKILLRAIQQARTEILVAIYTITRPQIEQALSSAAQRGVSVKVKYDVGQVPTSRMQELISNMENRGVTMIPIRMSGRHASMHNKFAVIDDKEVFTGSFNFTVMAITQNYENCVLIESPSVARDFSHEFNQIRSR